MQKFKGLSVSLMAFFCFSFLLFIIFIIFIFFVLFVFLAFWFVNNSVGDIHFYVYYVFCLINFLIISIKSLKLNKVFFWMRTRTIQSQSK